MAKSIFSPCSQLPTVIVLDISCQCLTTEGEFIRDLLEDITNYSSRQNQLLSPLLWIVCTPPPSHLITPLLATHPFPFEHQRLSLGDEEAFRDSLFLLRDGFSKNPEEAQPSEPQLRHLAKVVSGIFEFADMIIRFVNYGGTKQRQKQLKACLEYTANSPLATALTPYHAFDHFLYQVLSNIPPHILPDALHILHVQSKDHYKNPGHLAHLLGIGQQAFYDAIGSLYFVIKWVNPKHLPASPLLAMAEQDMYFLNKFFQDHRRSRNFVSETPLVSQSAIHILGHTKLSSLLKEVKWRSPKPYENVIMAYGVYGSIARNALSHFSKHIQHKVHEASKQNPTLHGFDPCCLVYTSCHARYYQTRHALQKLYVSLLKLIIGLDWPND